MDNKRMTESYLTIYNRRQKLLDMLYTPGELANEMNVKKSFVYNLVNTERVRISKDITGHIFINGMDVYRWITEYFGSRKEKRQKQMPLAENEFYCLHCKKRKKTDSFIVSDENGKSVKIAYCPDCNTKMRKYNSEAK